MHDCFVSGLGVVMLHHVAGNSMTDMILYLRIGFLHDYKISFFPNRPMPVKALFPYIIVLVASN